MKEKKQFLFYILRRVFNCSGTQMFNKKSISSKDLFTNEASLSKVIISKRTHPADLFISLNFRLNNSIED